MAKHSLEDLRHGAHVVSGDGKDVGRLHAVVVDPRHNDVTHIVVNAGPHFPEPGFGDARLVEVEIGEVREATEKRVALECTKKQFEDMPPYVERAFLPVSPEGEGDEASGAGNILWNAGVAIAGSLSRLLTGIAVPAETFRRAPFERHIMNDAPVWRQEPHTHIGDVERVLVNEETDEIEALVIRRGAVFSHEVVLPIEHVTEILDGVIHVSITDDDLKALEPFRGD